MRWPAPQFWVSVVATVAASGPAPFDAASLEWFAGMAEAGVGSNRAAAQGRAARQAWEDTAGDADFGFTAGDEEALGSRWAWMLDVVRPALEAGPGAAIWVSPGGGHITVLDVVPDALSWLAGHVLRAQGVPG